MAKLDMRRFLPAESSRERALAALTGGEINIGTSERVVSLALGTGLAAYALSRGLGPRVALLLLAAPFLDRGIRGHCAVSQLMGRSTAPMSERLHTFAS